MSDQDREVAKELIANSVVNGRVNFDKLREESNEWVRQQTSQTLSNSEHRLGRDGGARDVSDHFLKVITRATREVLGIIPESDWHYSDYVLADMGRRVYEAFDKDEPKRYECTLPKDFDPSESLGSQGVTCKVAAQPKAR